MTKETAIKLFEQKQIRSTWKDDEERWYFSIIDVIEVLTDTDDGKLRLTDVADTEQLFRLRGYE